MDVENKPTIEIYRGHDGTVVVHVDTHDLPENDRVPIIRVYLNDDLLFGNPDLHATE